MKRSLYFRRVVIIAMAAWTMVAAALVAGNYNDELRELRKLAIIQAARLYEKDLVFRRWVSGHGGVYVLVTEETPPNPYLSHLADRDVTTTTGLELTLMNPAYVTRQVYELELEQHGYLGHITSLNPLRPENAPDQWEVGALHAFERGRTEVVEITKTGNKEHLRLMRPLITEESCLLCHASQGYVVGDIRGGISVSVPIEPLRAAMRRDFTATAIKFGISWLLGLCGISFGAWRINQQIRERDAAEEAQRMSEEKYRTLFENAPVGIGVVLDDGDFVSSNAALLKPGGYPNRGTSQLKNVKQLYYDPADISWILAEGSEQGRSLQEQEVRLKQMDGTPYDALLTVAPISVGDTRGWQIICQDITERKQREKDREQLIHRLEAALEKVDTLSGLLPICAHCKKIRNDEGYWEDVAVYIRNHTEVDFSHGICDDCMREHYPDVDVSNRQT
jgi:PAS domain S-box-containing protein